MIIENTSMRGVDAVIDAVGFEAKGSTLETVLTNLKLEGSSGNALRQCIAAVRRGGTVSVPDLYAGFIHGFLFGDVFEKGIGFRTGQTHDQRFMPELLEYIEAGKLQPEIIISHRLALEYELAFTLFGNVAVILLVGLGTGLGHGPFKDHSSGLPLLTVVYTLTTLMIAASSAERRQANSRIFQLATRDALTGLINRSTFLERAEQALAGAACYRHRLAVLFIDLDNFKVVNDTLGHQAGDQVLLEASRRILTCLRLDSTLARFGGDEMVALIDCAENDSALITIANRIADSMAKPFPLLGQDCQISCSIGISRFPEDADSVSELMMKADIAMYEVKTSGRNGFRIFCPDKQNFLHTERRLPMTGEASPLSPPSPASTATA